MSGFQSFGFGSNDERIGEKSNRFKAEAGRTYRVSFASWPLVDGKLNLDAKTPQFTGAPRIFIDKIGFVINPSAEAVKYSNGGADPRMAIGTLLVVWPCAANGEVDKSRMQLANGGIRVQPWIFSDDKYRALVPCHSQFHFGSHDLMITCSDAKYQKMTFASCNNGLLRSSLEKGTSFADALLAEILSQQAALPLEIGREMTAQQIREKMASAGVNPSGPQGSGGGQSAMASSLSAVGAGQEIEDLLDGVVP